MQVYQGLEEFTKIDNAVVTTGTFDGVHLGHQSILKRLIEISQKINGENVILTFFPHPRMVLQSDTDLKLINTIDEKIQLLEEAGIDHLIIHPFTTEFSRTSSMEFVRDILVNQIGTKKLVIGYDHHFGRNREGSFEHLKEFGPLYGFEVEEIPAQDIEDVNISSTKIRKAIAKGDIHTARDYLGYAFSIHGKVIHGQKIGRELGFPTANLFVKNPYKLIPANGIYAVEVEWKGESFQGMLNIGNRPTVEENPSSVSIEVNIFDFNENIYGENLKISFVSRIRDEKKFASKDELVAEIAKDKSKVQALFR